MFAPFQNITGMDSLHRKMRRKRELLLRARQIVPAQNDVLMVCGHFEGGQRQGAALPFQRLIDRRERALLPAGLDREPRHLVLVGPGTGLRPVRITGEGTDREFYGLLAQALSFRCREYAPVAQLRHAAQQVTAIVLLPSRSTSYSFSPLLATRSPVLPSDTLT